MSLIGKVILSWILLIPLIINGQDKQTDYDDLTISITQQILPGPNPDFIYKISDQKVKIYKSRFGIRHRIYKERFDKIESDSLLMLIKNANLLTLGSDYNSGSLDGINWTFEIRINKKYKEIRLENYYLKELGDIVDFVNRKIPDDKNCISFDFFDTRNDFKNKQ